MNGIKHNRAWTGGGNQERSGFKPRVDRAFFFFGACVAFTCPVLPSFMNKLSNGQLVCVGVHIIGFLYLLPCMVIILHWRVVLGGGEGGGGWWRGWC